MKSILSTTGTAALFGELSPHIPDAFINDVLLKAGDKLSVKDGKSVYECEVVRIEKEMVVIRCGDSEITLKIEQASVTSD